MARSRAARAPVDVSPADASPAAGAVATWHRRRGDVCRCVCDLPLSREQRAELYELIGAHVAAAVEADRVVRLDLEVDPWPHT